MSEPEKVASPPFEQAVTPGAAETQQQSRFAFRLDKPEPRGEWPSRLAFYMATVGAAVGFGNVWRFPSLCVRYGGGAFFIPYLMALVLLGIPLAILEIGFGQYFQTGDIGVFGGFHPRLRGVGLASVGCGFMFNTYYIVLIAWVMNAFFDSFRADSLWRDPNIDGDEAVNYFIDQVIGSGTLPDSNKPSRFVPINVLYTFVTWVIIFLCVAWGVKWTGRIAYFTMGLPIFLLFVFLIKGSTLEGSEDGITEYIGIWDLSVLTEQPDVWSTACSQIFFSIGVTFGILTAYGSHCPRNEPAVLNATVVSVSNSLFSFIAGFAVFSALGHLALLQGVEVTELNYASFGLVFGTWPVVFSRLPGGIHWVRLIFFNLFLLGIDSAFAFLESLITVMHDTILFKHVPRFWLAAGIATIGFLFSLMYCTDAGLNFLDVVDFYINFVMILVGFLEAFGSAWAYDIVGQIERQGIPVVYSFMTANFGAVILGCILWFALPADVAVWAGFVGFFGFYFLFLGVTIFFAKKVVMSSNGKWTMKSMMWEVYFGNVLSLRDRMQKVIGPVPFLWCLLMKHFIPHILIILFVNLARSEDDKGRKNFSEYGGYPVNPYQVLGIIVVVFTLFVFLIGVFFPNLYAPLALPQTEEAKSELRKYSSTLGNTTRASETERVRKQLVEAHESAENDA